MSEIRYYLNSYYDLRVSKNKKMYQRVGVKTKRRTLLDTFESPLRLFKKYFDK